MPGFTFRDLLGGRQGDNICESILRLFGTRTREMRRKERVADNQEEERQHAPGYQYPPDRFGG